MAQIQCYSSIDYAGTACKITDPLTNLSAVVTARGGRLISLKFDDEKELVYSNAKLFSELEATILKPRRSVQWKEILIGGEKTWIGPSENFGGMVPYLYPDIGLYDIEEINGGVRLTSPTCIETGLQVVRDITFGDDGSGTFQIKAHIFNNSNLARKVSPWSVFQFLKPATVRTGQLDSTPSTDKQFEPVPTGVMKSYGDGSVEFHIGQDSRTEYKVSLPSQSATKKFVITTFGASGEPEIEITESFQAAAELYVGIGDYFETEAVGEIESVKPGGQSKDLNIKFSVKHL